MPIVIDNPQVNDVIVRLIFDDKLFTVFYRPNPCDAATDGLHLQRAFATDKNLADAQPREVIGNLDPQHYHFKNLPFDLAHVHISFEQSIENLRAITSIIKTLAKIHDLGYAAALKLQKEYAASFKVSLCSASYFTDSTRMLTVVKKPAVMPLLARHKACLWTTGKDYQLTQQIDCDELVANSMTLPEFNDFIKQAVLAQKAMTQAETSRTTIMPAALTNIPQDNLEATVYESSQDHLALMIALMFSIYVMRNLFRPLRERIFTP